MVVSPEKFLAVTTWKYDFRYDYGAGCDLFKYSLTDNGICQSFNNLRTNELFKPSEFVDAFQKTLEFESDDFSMKYFGGNGASKGIFICLVWLMSDSYFYP